jgi:hypothetical protein
VIFWDIASGLEVRRVAGSEFAFVEGPPKETQHVLTASDDTLLITELLPLGGTEEREIGN